MNKSEKFWDNNAAKYDKAEMKDQAVRAKILEKTKEYLKSEDLVLDYGCATGILTHEIAGDVKWVSGVDLSANMIRLAKEKAQQLHIHNVDYTHSTIFDERYKPETFDVVLGVYLLHLLPDMPKSLHRIYELLQPGGLFISVTPCISKVSILGILLSVVSKLGIFPRLELMKPDELEKEITRAGFNLLEVSCLEPKGQQYFMLAKKMI